jgi:hypothetical protein
VISPCDGSNCLFNTKLAISPFTTTYGVERAEVKGSLPRLIPIDVIMRR